jgi:hypothetical protein
MLIQAEAEYKSESGRRSRFVQRVSQLTLSEALIVFALFLCVTIGLQVASGAYRSEFAGYPDEPAHYVTSVMVREYLTSGQWSSPLKFAEAYYEHYPKVAFGHWPPVFYIVQSLWMLIFSAARASVRMEVAVTTSLLALSVFSEARRVFGRVAALLASLLLICVPVMQLCTDEEMAESLLILFCFWSTVYFARYLESQRWRDSGLFALFLSLAVLTKGNGWLLCGIPVIAVLLTRKWNIFGLKSFWYAVAMTLLLCLPWQLITLQSAERGWTGGSQPSVAYTLSAIAGYGRLFVRIPGLVLATLVVVGVIAEIVLPVVQRREVKAMAAAMFALIVAAWAFHSLVPAGVEDRKLALALPAMMLYVFWGGLWVSDRLPDKLTSFGRRAIVTAAAGAAFFAFTFSVPHDTRFGYIDAATFIASQPQLRGATILSSSNNDGEGLLVSELAMRAPKPAYTVLRGTKVMSRVDWVGSEYVPLVSSPGDVFRVLRDRGVTIVVIDEMPTMRMFDHERLLWNTIRTNPSRFQKLAVFKSDDVAAAGSKVSIFRFVS